MIGSILLTGGREGEIEILGGILTLRSGLFSGRRVMVASPVDQQRRPARAVRTALPSRLPKSSGLDPSTRWLGAKPGALLDGCVVGWRRWRYWRLRLLVALQGMAEARDISSTYKHADVSPDDFFLVLTFIFSTIALVGLLVNNKIPPLGAGSPPLTVESLKNASYRLGDDTITLKDGVREFENPNPDSPERTIDVRIIEWAFGDLDGHGDQDAVVVLAANWGGSGVSMYLIPVMNEAGVPQTLNRGFVSGDRNAFRSVSIQNRTVTVQYLKQGDYDPLCCPTVLTTIHVRLHGRELECADQDCRD